MSQASDKWLLQSVQYFRSLGFFAEYAALSDEQLATHLTQAAMERHGVIDPADQLADLMLLSLDEQRVWWDDTEADVCAENKVYVDTLAGWSKISRGAFKPENIRETWDHESGPIHVEFEHQGKKITLHPSFQDDYIDLNILQSINKIVADTGIQFRVHAIFDQTAFIVALTQDEKRKLEKDRGWKFAL